MNTENPHSWIKTLFCNFKTLKWIESYFMGRRKKKTRRRKTEVSSIKIKQRKFILKICQKVSHLSFERFQEMMSWAFSCFFFKRKKTDYCLPKEKNQFKILLTSIARISWGFFWNWISVFLQEMTNLEELWKEQRSVKMMGMNNLDGKNWLWLRVIILNKN